MALNDLSAADQEAVEMVHEIVGKLEEALFQTFVAADRAGHAKSAGAGVLRDGSKVAWLALADTVIKFALSDA